MTMRLHKIFMRYNLIFGNSLYEKNIYVFKWMIYSGVKFIRFSFRFLDEIEFMNISCQDLMIGKYLNGFIAMHF